MSSSETDPRCKACGDLAQDCECGADPADQCLRVRFVGGESHNQHLVSPCPLPSVYSVPIKTKPPCWNTIDNKPTALTLEKQDYVLQYFRSDRGTVFCEYHLMQ